MRSVNEAHIGRAGDVALPALVAFLLLSIVTIPVAVAKLDLLLSSELALTGAPAPACVPSGVCLRFLPGPIGRAASGYAVPVRIEGADNVFEVAQALEAGTLRTIVADGSLSATPTIEPSYPLYISRDEAERRLPAALVFPEPPPPRLTLAFAQGTASSEYLTVETAQSSFGKLAGFIIDSGRSDQLRLGAALAILLLAALTAAVEARATGQLRAHMFAAAVIVRWLAIVAAARIPSPTWALLVAVIILLPWLRLAELAFPPAVRHSPAGYRTAPGGRLAGAPWEPARRFDHPSLVEAAMLLLGLVTFAYMLWFGDSFRWSIFEERDFLEARRVLSQLVVPPYRP